MRKSYVALVAAGLLLTIGSSAEAAGRGGAGTSFAPPGLRSTNPAFSPSSITQATTPSQTTGYGPSGWTQGGGKAADPWKGITSGTPASSPPGLSGGR